MSRRVTPAGGCTKNVYEPSKLRCQLKGRGACAKDGGGVPPPPAKDARSASVPLNLLRSTFSEMPATRPLSLCCQNVQRVHGVGMSGQSDVYCAIQSALEASARSPPT